MKNNYKHYPTFQDTLYKPLAAYNRLITAMEVRLSLSTGQAAMYLEQFEEAEAKLISAVGGSIQALGQDEVKRRLILRMNELGLGEDDDGA